MSKLTEEELALLTDEERKGYLEDEDDGADDDNDTADDSDANDYDADDSKDDADDSDDSDDSDSDQDADDTAGQENADADSATDQAGDDKMATEEATVITKNPIPLFNAELPADIEQKRTALDQREDDITRQYEEGDITFTEFNKANRGIYAERSALDRAELKASLAFESQQNLIEQNWVNAQNVFTAAHPELDLSNPAVFAAFDSFVREETKTVMEKGGAVGVPEMERALKRYNETFGIADTAQKQVKQEQKQAPAPKKERKPAPPTLAKVPASDANSTDDGRFAYLDRLEGVAYEEALAKLTPAQLDEYSRAG